MSSERVITFPEGIIIPSENIIMSSEGIIIPSEDIIIPSESLLRCAGALLPQYAGPGLSGLNGEARVFDGFDDLRGCR
jgi:hypothetical protein